MTNVENTLAASGSIPRFPSQTGERRIELERKNRSNSDNVAQISLGNTSGVAVLKITPPTILVVDDDAAVAESHHQLVQDLGYQSELITDPNLVAHKIQTIPNLALVLLDLRMPSLSGIEVLQQIKLARPDLGVIIATVVNDVEEAVKATRLGAYNYLLKPLQAQRLDRVICSFLKNRPPQLVGDLRFRRFITQSPKCLDIFKRINAFSQSDAPILVHGPTGTGKEVVAQILHSLGNSRKGPFIAVNVAAISPHLFESELFGHRRGAFTGAFRDRIGYFGQAKGVTIFLDEIGELSPEHQKKLLRVIENRRYARVGDEQEMALEARLILATNRDLASDARSETFRADLYYRFSSHMISIPSLRERPEDIELLALYFLEKYSSQYGRSISRIDDDCLEMLRDYPFPGNVRELDGLISAAVLLETSNTLRAETFPVHVRSQNISLAADDLEGMRIKLILNTLAECDGNQTRAAEKLGIARGTLNRLLKRMRGDYSIVSNE